MFFSFFHPSGTFYKEELQKIKPVKPDEFFVVERILKSRTQVRGRKKTKQYFVSWLNWPDKFNSWVNAADVKNIKKP